MSNGESGERNALALLQDCASETEIQDLYVFSQYQDSLFSDIVDVVEDTRLESGLKPYLFYGRMGVQPNKAKRWVSKDIHKFFLSDIAWIAFKAGYKIKLSFEPIDAQPKKGK